MRNLSLGWVLVFGLGLQISGLAVRADDRYVKRDIVEARYGDSEKRKLLNNAYQLEELVNSNIIGQSRIAKVAQARVIQYLENFGSRQNEPIALHILGLPGVGKSAILSVFQKVGLAVYKVDMQEHVSEEPRSVADVLQRLRQFLLENKGKPTVLLFDELDKVPEISSVNGVTQEQTRPILGLFNQILNDGKAQNSSSSQPVDVSNCLIVSAMNFPPGLVEEFAQEVLGTAKSFYDFTIEDFVAMNEWLSHGPSGRSKLLARMFRSNTVSRLLPNTVIAKSLDAQDYRSIVQLYAELAIKQSTQGNLQKRRVTAEVTGNFLEFLNEVAVFAPSGARETVFRVNALTEQLVNFGMKARDPGESTLDRPRHLVLDYNPDSKRARVTVEPRLQRGRTTVPGESFSFEIDFDSDARCFVTPKELATGAPPVKNGSAQQGSKPVTIREIRETRFPKTVSVLKGMAEKLDAMILGQTVTTHFLEKELASYLAKTDPAPKGPPFTVLAGFPGIGKSMLADEVARALGLPVVRINLEAFSSSESNAATDFIVELDQKVKIAQANSPNGKFLLLIEELDKVSEIDPIKGELVNRPVMTYIKDLLSNGVLNVTVKANFMLARYDIDVRGAYGMVTMNFGIDRFGFKADPRLTTPEDMMSAWKRLSSSPADMKAVLSSLFRPETVSRLMPYFRVMPPMERKDYTTLIELQPEAVVQERLVDRKSGRNRGQIGLSLSPSYRAYLYTETVIPSEGPRNTVTMAKARIQTDLEAALKAIPKSSPLASKPITIILDYLPGQMTVVAKMVPQASPESTPVEITRRKVALTFPPISAEGLMPERRLLVALHEFGHAYSAIRLGRRFELASAVSPQQGTGGYVKFKPSSDIPTAKKLLSELYSMLASRAMERVFLGANPSDASSIVAISNGSSNDTMQATKALFNLIYEFGLDPFGGVMERQGVSGPGRYANFSDLPHETVEQLGRILRDLENYLVQDFLRAHPKEWYVNHIAEFARTGVLNEKEFYALIGYVHPGENSIHIGETSRLEETFRGRIMLLPEETKAAKEFKQGQGNTTAEQNLQRATNFFLASLKARLHHDLVAPPAPIVRKESGEYGQQKRNIGFKAAAVTCEGLFLQ